MSPAANETISHTARGSSTFLRRATSPTPYSSHAVSITSVISVVFSTVSGSFSEASAVVLVCQKAMSIAPPWPPKSTIWAKAATRMVSATTPVAARSTRRVSSSWTTQAATAPHTKAGMNVAFAPDRPSRARTSATQVSRSARRFGRSTSRISITAGIEHITP